MSTRAANFVSWLLEDVDTVTAEVGTPRDEQLREFARDGFLRFSGCTCGTNNYEIITGGFRAFWDAAAMHERAAPSLDRTMTAQPGNPHDPLS
jgi:hypothetical protein